MVERIRKLCEAHGTNFSQLEKDLDFGNGSLAKTSEKTQASRFIKLSKYFNVSLDYLLTGVESPKNAITDDERRVLALYRNFNATGKSEALKRISELSELGRYTEQGKKSSFSKIG